MNEKPILFNSEMVKAILDGRKTQTRRVITDHHGIKGDGVKFLTYVMGIAKNNYYMSGNHVIIKDTDGQPIGSGFRCPYGAVGDYLYVRETWAMYGDVVHFRADYPMTYQDGTTIDIDCLKWKPSIHMFKDHSRIKLKITDIRVERVADIGHDDARAEGIEQINKVRWNNYEDNESVWSNPMASFRTLWDSINAKRKDGIYSWESNPWVWVVTFERNEPK